MLTHNRTSECVAAVVDIRTEAQLRGIRRLRDRTESVSFYGCVDKLFGPV
ncbi:hypothetical protein EXN66_Car019568 [Channa argus]|uniref:Uncharacterized protein n=1 Tax=Channa argus TaxID=215402 RepID=A0A6G1QME3_CHAAH|nr:hypothetical protein EXN66_Car019568 [Channa argus]